MPRNKPRKCKNKNNEGGNKNNSQNPLFHSSDMSGFYYDEVKRKYFKIMSSTEGHIANAVTTETVRKQQQQNIRCRRREQRNRLQRQTHKKQNLSMILHYRALNNTRFNPTNIVEVMFRNQNPEVISLKNNKLNPESKNLISFNLVDLDDGQSPTIVMMVEGEHGSASLLCSGLDDLLGSKELDLEECILDIIDYSNFCDFKIFHDKVLVISNALAFNSNIVQREYIAGFHSVSLPSKNNEDVNSIYRNMLYSGQNQIVTPIRLYDMLEINGGDVGCGSGVVHLCYVTEKRVNFIRLRDNCFTKYKNFKCKQRPVCVKLLDINALNLAEGEQLPMYAVLIVLSNSLLVRVFVYENALRLPTKIEELFQFSSSRIPLTIKYGWGEHADYMFIGDSKCQISLFNTEKQLVKYKGCPYKDVSKMTFDFNKEQTVIFSVGWDFIVRVWKVTSGEMLSELHPFNNGSTTLNKNPGLVICRWMSEKSTYSGLIVISASDIFIYPINV